MKNLGEGGGGNRGITVLNVNGYSLYSIQYSRSLINQAWQSAEWYSPAM